MESQRSFLFIGLALVSFLLWQNWQVDYGPKPIQQTEQPSTLTESDTPSVASLPSDVNSDELFIPKGDSNNVSVAIDEQQNRFINLNTGTLMLTIDLIGGDVVSADLLDYPVSQDSDEPLNILRPDNGIYVAQSGLVGTHGPDSSSAGRPKYNTSQQNYTLGETDDSLIVPLTWQNDTLKVTKTFIIAKHSHDIQVEYQIDNLSNSPIQVQQYAQLKQTTEVEDSSNMFMPTYRGAAYSTDEKRYKKYKFSKFEDDSLNLTTQGGWVAMLEHYFVSAWVPPQEQKNALYSKLLRNGNAIIGFTGEPLSIEANDSQNLSTLLYVGPKIQAHLATLARGLDLTVDYGPLFWISQPLFSLLSLLHDLVNNWGVAIILITVIVKGLMYPLTKKQYESMAKMRNLAPKMQQLKDKYGDDRQKMSQAMMEMYKKEKVNPMGGCFPLLLQMPIFLALYWALLESVELRHAEFFLWITDLSIKDPYFVLPVLTGASMYLLQKLQPSTMTDPMQQKVMQLMPVFMSVFFLWFPAGLVLYWLVSNVITLVQAKIIYASMEKRGIKTH
jgi:YidC/Oxa1 family membrane protein insertase